MVNMHITIAVIYLEHDIFRNELDVYSHLMAPYLHEKIVVIYTQNKAS